MGISWGWATDVGLRRAHNEDALLARAGLFVVADGMGGHAAGEVASRLAVQAFSDLADHAAELTADAVQATLTSSGQRIQTRSEQDSKTAGMATTVVGMAAVMQGESPYWIAFNIGDSRLYHCRTDGVERISVDHSYVQELVDEGRLRRAGTRDHPSRSVITRALGIPGSRPADFWLFPREPGQRFLLCSDGLTDEVNDTGIAATLATSVGPQDAADRLVSAALQAGGSDNVSVIVVDVASGPDPLGADPGATAPLDTLWP